MTEPKYKPIIFSAPMVKAILEGRKTQTRRIVKPQPFYPVIVAGDPETQRFCVETHELMSLESFLQFCHYGQPGDRLWVRETFAIETTKDYEGDSWILPPEGPFQWDGHDNYRLIPRYRATAPETELMIAPSEKNEIGMRWSPSIYMPRWASRITLEITGVRVERLQDIAGDDIFHEGIQRLENHSWHATGAIPLGTYRGLDEWTDKFNYWVDPRDAYKALWESTNGPGSWEKNPWVWVVEFKRVEE